MSKDILNNNSFTKINVSCKDNIKNFINDFLNEEKNLIFNIYGNDELVILDEIKKYFIPVQAAGGIVINNKKEILIIKRLGFWDFPKGKLEKGESPQQGAIREVSEECGIIEKDLKVNNHIKNTFHIYPLNDSYALKETIWYSMEFVSDYELKPQTEEGITEIKWVSKSEIQTLFENSYPSLLDLIDSV